MIAGCAAIIGIFSIMSVSFAASKKWKAAVSVFPMMIVPIFHLLGNVISKSITASVSIEIWMVKAIIDTLGLVLSCLFLGLFSLNVKSVPTRVLFLSITVIYCIILFFILVFDIVLPFIS